MYLGASLTGNACKVLSVVDVQAEGAFGRLVRTLEQRFQPVGQETLHRTRLRCYRQRKEETLQQLGDAVERLVYLAYPTADMRMRDEMSKEVFMGAIGSAEVRQWVHQGHPMTFADAQSAALQADSFLQRERETREIHQVRSSQGEVVASVPSR